MNEQKPFSISGLKPAEIAVAIKEQVGSRKLIVILGQDLFDAFVNEESGVLTSVDLKRRVREWCEANRFVYGWSGDFLELYVV